MNIELLDNKFNNNEITLEEYLLEINKIKQLDEAKFKLLHDNIKNGKSIYEIEKDNGLYKNNSSLHLAKNIYLNYE